MTDDLTAPLLIDDDVMAPGFIAVPRVIWRHPTLSLAARGLFVSLLDYAWDVEHPCWPGYQRLMARMTCSHTSLTKYIRELQRAGYLSITRRGQGLTNVYTLHVRPAQAERKILAIKDSGTPERQNLASEVDSEELEQVWLRALGQLRPSMSAPNFGTWFEGTTLVGLRHGTATVEAATYQHQGLARLGRLLCHALSEASGQTITHCTIASRTRPPL